MGLLRACGLNRKWRHRTGNGKVTWFGIGNRWPVGKKGWRAQETGSHVIWDGKPLASGRKGIAGSGPLRNAGSKSKVQFKHQGRSIDSKKRRHVGKQKIIYSMLQATTCGHGSKVMEHFVTLTWSPPVLYGLVSEFHFLFEIWVFLLMTRVS